MSEDSRAYRAAVQAMAQSGTADLDTLARAAVNDAAPFIRGNERGQCIALAQSVDATYPAERDPAPEQRRADAASGRYPFSEYLEDTYAADHDGAVQAERERIAAWLEAKAEEYGDREIPYALQIAAQSIRKGNYERMLELRDPPGT
jgi:hypothetical protein